jgi:hypothetical protein
MEFNSGLKGLKLHIFSHGIEMVVDEAKVMRI